MFDIFKRSTETKCHSNVLIQYTSSVQGQRAGKSPFLAML